MKTKSKLKTEPITTWDDDELWCKVDSPDDEYGWCGYYFGDEKCPVAPDQEVPEVITCPDCLEIVRAQENL